MKKRLFAVLLTAAMMLSMLPLYAFAAEPAAADDYEVTGYAVGEAESVETTTTKEPTEAEAYQKMIALKSSYPEGMRWTNDNFYAWKGGIYYGGYGCAGFAFLLSDAAFGDLPARMHTEFTYDQIRVGDILRINNDTHSVIILAKTSTYVTIAEGNYNSSIHWGRTLSKEKVLQSDYIMTRYTCDHTFVKTDVPATCISSGYYKYTCTKCGYVYEEIYDYEVKPHTWDNGVVTTEPTLTEKGERVYTCKVCGREKTEEIPVLDPAFPFYDVDEDDWFYSYAKYAYENGIMAGVGARFDPYSDLSRAMVAQILYAHAGKPAVTANNPFADVKSNAWYYDAVRWAYKNGIVAGTSKTTYAPGISVTREQFATILYAHAGKPAVQGDLSQYPDAAKVSSWAQDAMIWAVENGIISGMPSGEISPKGTANRAQAATMLMKYMSLQ